MPAFWLELAVTAEPEAVEAICELMGRYTPGGVGIEEPYALLDDGQAAETIAGARGTVRVYVPGDAAGEEARARIEEGLWHLRQIGFGNIGEIATHRLAEQYWAKAWKEHYHVVHLGRRTVIKPSWGDYEPQPGEVVVELDPGMAFGTGLHPTTRTCLLALEETLRPGDRVLDVGSGSGILSLAALKLGAARVLALDVSTVAVEATQANARANGVADRLDARLATLAGAAGEAYFPLPPEGTMLGARICTLRVVLGDIIAPLVPPHVPARS